MASARFYRLCQISLAVFCTIGILVSLYAYHVETKKEQDSSYVAYCDIGEYISCSKAFASRYGKGFGLLEYVIGKDHWMNQPNSVFGIIYYLIQLLLDRLHKPRAAAVQVALSIVANMGSVYLALILYFVLYDFCIVCASMYFVNFIILGINVLRYRFFKVRRPQQRGDKKKA